MICANVATYIPLFVCIFVGSLYSSATGGDNTAIMQRKQCTSISVGESTF